MFARELTGESGMESPARLFKALLSDEFLTTPAEAIPVWPARWVWTPRRCSIAGR